MRTTTTNARPSWLGIYPATPDIYSDTPPPRGTSVNLPSATQTSLDLSATNQEPPVTVSDRLPTEWQGALFIPSRTLPTLGTGGTGSTFLMLVDG